MTLIRTFCTNLRRRTLALAAGTVACALAVPTLAQSDAKAPAASEAKPASSDTKKQDTKDRKESKSDKSSDEKKSEKSKADSQSSKSDTANSSNQKESAKTSAKSGQTAAEASKSKDSKSSSADAGKPSSAAANDRTKKTDNRPQPTSKGGNADRKSQDASEAFRNSEKEARDERENVRREVNELRGNGDQPDSRARSRQDGRDNRQVRDIDRDRNVNRDRDVRDDRSTRERDIDRDLDVNRNTDGELQRRDIDIDRDVRDRRDRRDLDRRDTDVDVRARSDRDVSRTRIENFRADSLTARQLGVTFGRAGNRGLVIDNIARNAVLADVGLRRGDVIVSVADHRIGSEDQFIQWLFAQDLRNQPVRVVVLRDGRQVPIEVQPIRIIREIVNVRSDVDPLRQFGVVLDQRVADRVVVVRVVPESPAFVAGIRPGDVIVTLSGRPVRGPQQFVQVLQRVEPGQLAVEVNRARQTQQFRVDMPVRRTVARPDLDVDRPAIERREERRENRIERREERRDGVPGVNNNTVPPAQPAGPGLLPRNR
jgi:hypothetical protein